MPPFEQDPFEIIKTEESKTKLSIQNDIELAEHLDRMDPLSKLRDEFLIPKHKNRDVVYMAGNSLGLQPKLTRKLIEEELQVWGECAAEGHANHRYGRPWVTAEEGCAELMALIVGGGSEEVSIMGTLTGNIHLLMSAFYHPTSTRFKVLIENKAFPSDYFAIESQLQMHQIDVSKGLIELNPKNDDLCLATEEILDEIQRLGDELSIVYISAVHYFTGQFYDIQAITKAAHSVGAIIGLDLAHAIGNVPLELHDWGVDFAAWCSYKYLNSGPGGIAGIFVHSKHDNNDKLTILRGWWSHELKSRFKMDNELRPIKGAKGFQISNPNILALTSLRSSLEVFSKTNMNDIRRKSRLLSAYFRILLSPQVKDGMVAFITPEDPKDCGAQLSIRILKGEAQMIQKRLQDDGVTCDYRYPQVLRFAPTGLYNTFKDVFLTVEYLKKYLQ